MMYKKVVKDGYILGVGKVTAGGNIDEKEYNHLADIFHSVPETPDGFQYCLRVDETWELVKKDPDAPIDLTLYYVDGTPLPA
jgi:hypothetical protein